MSDQVLAAIERVHQGFTEPDKHSPDQDWVVDLRDASRFWIDEEDIKHVEIALETGDLDSGSRFLITVFTKIGIVLQGVVSYTDGTYTGSFDGWKIVRMGRLTALSFSPRKNARGERVFEFRAEFKGLEPVTVPADLNIAPDEPIFMSVWADLRDAYIDSGLADRIYAGTK